ncbi:hypothetical protein [Nocardia sp. alder85J]|uniref:hypothetical protein n=1 Tax=Nocardia sp. alder85J TaxID=2862949 RepID=UPI001CD43129|nr:hypothetical protein [Nocardia sp. alder85J]MCX4095004.1 hypothetical protein [Nocardia sp. alder85J]
MRTVREKDYLELMRDIAAFRRALVTADRAERARLDRAISEHHDEVRKRDRHGR